ncbi:LAME_0B04830g1_1 [Lachancea meyersii CBS 8951]|uniref:endopeptidase La n=1 Tax=Lachancea meyersii CBS 8951 TaxID=1266667 RepID=A0A1G4IVA5_9SACH|nr:LAME_0B04830g1_1 [Lachancea meyersii CBS 8951]
MPFQTSFPCLRPDTTPHIVPLPGVSYQFNVPKPDGLKALQLLKYPGIEGLDEALDSEIKERTSSSDVFHLFAKFEAEFLLPEQGNNVYTCLVPTSDTACSRGCIAKLQSFKTEKEMMILNFKGIRRATIINPELNLHNEIWIGTLIIHKDAELMSGLNAKARTQAVRDVQRCFRKMTTCFKVFKSRYRKALGDKDNDFGRVLLISPLANMLFLQLNRESFLKSWDSLARACKLFEAMIAEVQEVEALLLLLDMAVSILPLTHSQRLRFLSLDKASERLAEFITIEQKLTALLTELYNSVKAFEGQLQELTAQEKANFVALHLSALRSFLGISRKARNRIDSAGVKGSREAVARSGGNAQDDDDDDGSILERFLDGLSENEIHPDGRKMLRKDLRRLKKMHPQNSEYQVLKNYFDVIMDIPFKTSEAKINPVDLQQSKEKLDADHFGLRDVKKRLVEYLSVLKLNESFAASELQAKPPILLLVGPPGVGKTSIAKSIADVLGRKFHRISLGGIYNEAEIRGHRRTYVGAMCGLIINALRKSGSMKPLILLDEIDKALSLTGSGRGGRGASLNGDPGAALLEVLDPEQNSTFTDHYVGFPVDLSNVLFFCTANDTAEISAPLLNRMEVIEIPGYTLEEKIEIGSKFLLPKQMRLNGLDKVGSSVELTRDAWNELVSEYTREPGVRSLERKLAGLVRGKIVDYVNGTEKSQPKVITSSELVKYLGFPLHPVSKDLVKNVRFAEKSGVVKGLAYSSDGVGGVLVFEIVRTGTLNGDQSGPKVRTTGNLGNLLNESIEIATALVKSLRERKVVEGMSQDPFEEFLHSELHLHVPMGAVSKDGPSAGLAITLALLSTAFKMPVSPDLCMTGEITSRGKVLPIGGVKEKLLGARLFGMKRVMVPLSNRSDVIESVMESEFFEQCLRSSGFPEVAAVQEKWHLELHYVDDLFDAIGICWPQNFHVKDTTLFMLPTSKPMRASL